MPNPLTYTTEEDAEFTRLHLDEGLTIRAIALKMLGSSNKNMKVSRAISRHIKAKGRVQDITNQ